MNRTLMLAVGLLAFVVVASGCIGDEAEPEPQEVPEEEDPFEDQAPIEEDDGLEEQEPQEDEDIFEEEPPQ